MKIIKTIISRYSWLVLAMISLFLAGGDHPVEIAVWLSPLLLLRFYHEVKLWKGFVFSMPLVVVISLIADKGMIPIPFNIIIRLTIITSVIALIPYVTDRLLIRSLPKSVKTLLFPMTAVAVEAFIASGFTGGTWGNPAYGINDMHLLQLVSVTGLWGMMFLIYWSASVFNEVWEHRHHLLDIRGIIIAFLTIFSIVYGFGLWRLHHKKPGKNIVRVAGITNGPASRAEMMRIFGKIFSSKRTGTLDVDSIRATIEKKYQELLTESIRLAKSGVEIVAWPEGATFIFESNEEMYIQQALQSIKEHKFYLGMGVMVLKDNCRNLVANNQPFMKNMLLFIAPDGKIVWEYSKRNLAPGYEKAMTIPGDGILKSSDNSIGKVTGVICYDMDFPKYIRQAGLLKSDLLIAPSNDWLEIKNTHTKMARLRAIENGFSLLRPANSGLSIAVDPYGNIVSSVDDFKCNGIPLVAVLPMGSVQTCYTLLGDFWTWICAFGGFILIILGIVRRWRARHASQT